MKSSSFCPYGAISGASSAGQHEHQRGSPPPILTWSRQPAQAGSRGAGARRPELGGRRPAVTASTALIGRPAGRAGRARPAARSAARLGHDHGRAGEQRQRLDELVVALLRPPRSSSEPRPGIWKTCSSTTRAADQEADVDRQDRDRAHDRVAQRVLADDPQLAAARASAPRRCTRSAAPRAGSSAACARRPSPAPSPSVSAGSVSVRRIAADPAARSPRPGTSFSSRPNSSASISPSQNAGIANVNVVTRRIALSSDAVGPQRGDDRQRDADHAAPSACRRRSGSRSAPTRWPISSPTGALSVNDVPKSPCSRVRDVQPELRAAAGGPARAGGGSAAIACGRARARRGRSDRVARARGG